MTCESIALRMIDLSRRLSRAIEAGRGIKIEADDLDAIVTIDGFSTIDEAARKALKEQARWRAQQKSYIDGGNSGSQKTESATELSAAPISKSSGMTPTGNGREALARAQMTLRRPS